MSGTKGTAQRALSGGIAPDPESDPVARFVGLLLIANTINAGADIGAIAAAINLLVPPLPIGALIVPVAVTILALQVWGSCRLVAGTFKWLTLRARSPRSVRRSLPGRTSQRFCGP